MIEVTKIKLGTQTRAGINNEKIDEYAKAIDSGAQFPPVTLFFDQTNYWLIDGFHRYYAHIKVDRALIHEEIKLGTERDAWLYSLGTNANHGLTRTNADKRKVVTLALADSELKMQSNRDIAKICNVTHTLVNDIRNEQAKPKVETASTKLSKKSKTKVEAASTQENNQAKKDGTEEGNDTKQHEIEDAKNAIKVLEEMNTRLLDGIALAQLPPDEQITAAEIITGLRKEKKFLTDTLDAVKIERGILMREKVSKQNQMAMQRKQIKELEAVLKNAEKEGN